MPDVLVTDGEVISAPSWSVECVYTPGHTSNHMCFQLQQGKALFTGDHVMGWSTSIISPPDGDMGSYMKSLDKLLQRDDEVYWPTHGPAIVEPHVHVQSFVEHRHDRERQILACIDEGISNIKEMVPGMYKDTPEFMYPAAARSVLAAMEYLVQQGVLKSSGEVTMAAEYQRA
jgi:glyoxylase-like metal-dependent hydrolase (beta-lactamase superfamily II)